MLAINRLLVQAPAVTPAHVGGRARGAWPVGAVLAGGCQTRRNTLSQWAVRAAHPPTALLLD